MQILHEKAQFCTQRMPKITISTPSKNVDFCRFLSKVQKTGLLHSSLDCAIWRQVKRKNGPSGLSGGPCWLFELWGILLHLADLNAFSGRLTADFIERLYFVIALQPLLTLEVIPYAPVTRCCTSSPKACRLSRLYQSEAPTEPTSFPDR